MSEQQIELLAGTDGEWQKLLLYTLFRLQGDSIVRVSAQDIEACRARFAPAIPVIFVMPLADGGFEVRAMGKEDAERYLQQLA